MRSGAAAVRKDPSRYAEMLAVAATLLNADRQLSETDRLVSLLAIIDRLASAAIAGAIDVGGGEVMAAALRRGRFDAFLKPESRSALLSEAEAP